MQASVKKSLQIKDLTVGARVAIDLVVKTSELKLTRNKKQYLALELFDGMSSISGNAWDWPHNIKPERNDILSVNATVTEYLGKLQLNISSITVNRAASLYDFAPKGNIDINACVLSVKDLIATISHDELRDIVARAFTDNSSLWKTVPGAKSVHHAYVAGTLKHSLDTALKARAIAEMIPNCNIDLCTAGGLLHDIGKLKTYMMDGVIIDYTIEGNLYEHIMLGSVELERYRTEANTKVLDLLQHIVLSHHGSLEFGSPITPKFIEAWVVHFADDIDAKVAIALEANARATTTYTDRIWAFGNCQLLTQDSVTSMMREVTNV